MKLGTEYTLDPLVDVTLRVRVWIETSPDITGLMLNYVTLRVRVWIETSPDITGLMLNYVTLRVRVWIETFAWIHHKEQKRSPSA